jgi:NAD dependent epimerase/dehydratase family enzyme
MVFREFAHELLDSKRVLPAAATAQGFGFAFSELTAAISDIIA